MTRSRIPLLFLLLLGLLPPLRAQPPQQTPPPWSAGLFVSHDSQPYRGAGGDTRVLPFVSYRGERLQWFGPLLRYRLAHGRAGSLALHSRVQFAPYEEDDAPILEDLGDRSTTALGGFDAELQLNRAWSGVFSLEMEMFGAHDGVETSAALERRLGHPGMPLFGAIGGGIRFQDENWNQNSVGVPADKARPGRPAYDPGASTHPFVYARVLYRPAPRYTLQLFLRATFLDDTWTDSPLIGDEVRTGGFLTAGYSF